jgi:hypothetical protein
VGKYQEVAEGPYTVQGEASGSCSERGTWRSEGASCVGNAWGAYRAMACTNQVEEDPFQASLADQGSTEGKRRRSCGTVPPVEPNPLRTTAVESVGEQEGQGVANAVVEW